MVFSLFFLSFIQGSLSRTYRGRDYMFSKVAVVFSPGRTIFGKIRKEFLLLLCFHICFACIMRYNVGLFFVFSYISFCCELVKDYICWSQVYKRSNEICLQLYEKELLTDTSYLYIYGLVIHPIFLSCVGLFWEKFC